MLKTVLYGWVAFFLFISTSVAQPQTFESGDKQVLLLELYTSQGCSSCPPAESWIDQWESSEALWKRIVPLSFHVDYWDRLGWKDPYASPAYTKRQRRYAAELNARTIYTPGFFANGQEWRGFFNRGKLPVSQSQPGNLSASYDDGTLTISFEGSGAQHAQVAWLAFDNENEVTRGENRGRRLKSTFTVKKLQNISLNKQNEATLQIGKKSDLISGRAALAVWVYGEGSMRPIQATGSWIN